MMKTMELSDRMIDLCREFQSDGLKDNIIGSAMCGIGLSMINMDIGKQGTLDFIEKALHSIGWTDVVVSRKN